jgi:soluble lytic murein transglycosylase-like protein
MKAVLALLLALIAFARPGMAATAEDPESAYYAKAYAEHYHVPVELVHAIIAQESGWNQRAVSVKGARGLMQLMPPTAASLGVRDSFDKSQNIGGGVRYLRCLLREFDGDMRLAVAAYFAGDYRVGRRGLSYRNPEVVAYVRQVRQRYLTELKLHRKQTEEKEGQ